MKFSATASLLFFWGAAVFAQPQPPKSNLRTKSNQHDDLDLLIARDRSSFASSAGLRGGSNTGLAEDTSIEEEDLPTTLAQELDKLEKLKGHLEPDDEVLVLHDLLLKAANAKVELEQALQDAGVNAEEMESIFTDHDDLAEDVLTVFDDLEQENRELGDDIATFLQNHIIEEADGTLRYQPSAEHLKEQEELERQQDHRRQLEEKSQLRWDKYHRERRLLTQKVREHHATLERHLTEAHPCSNVTATAAEPAAESTCYSEALQGYQQELGDLVVVLEEEMGPFTIIMDQIGEAVAGVRKAAGTVGSLAGMFKVLKRMPGFFKVIFGSAYLIFNGLDTGADPVEKAVDHFEDFVLGIWENTAGAVLDMIYGFEAHIDNAVGLFSFAAEAQHIPALPGLVKGLFGIDLGQFSNGLQAVERHVHDILVKLQELMAAFASETFEQFRTKASDFIEAIKDINAFMVPFDAVAQAYEYKITLPFGMPRTLMSRKLGRASCDPHQHRYTRADQYSGTKVFDLMAPWNVACKERCPSSHDTLSGGLKCRKKCSSYGLGRHEVLGIQDGCLRASRDKPLRSLPWGQKCTKKIGSAWYRTLPSDKCRPRCHNWLGAGNYYAEFYGKCTLSCPSGMPNHPTFPNKACKIPDSHKFERSKLSASCNQYTNNGQLDVYLKNTGGCYEDCKSNEHSFRLIFFCVSKDKLQISVKDIVDFIANVLSKIEKIPGVGEILKLIDTLLEPLFGFLEELIPDDLGFPEFDLGIDADFLNFGAIADVFDKLNLPALPQLHDVIGDTISSLGSKIQETPLGQIASCATNMECLVNATGLGDNSREIGRCIKHTGSCD